MRASTLFAYFATAALVTLVEAHGAVYKIQVAGQTFESGLIGTAADGPISVPTDNSPITDVTSDNMFCGSVASPGTTTPSIDLSQGNTISFYWNSGYSNGSFWPHNTGPMFLYMAQCQGDCSSQTPSSTKFIKIEQQGFDGTAWAQAALTTGSPATFTIPSDLASGNWLMRHEIINLASTDENFPSCSQFAITGGNNSYSTAQTAQFPGAYSASNAGLTVAGSAVYSIKSNAAYTFPGPNPIISSDGASSGSSASSVSASAVSASTGVAGTSISTGSPSSVLIAATSLSGPSTPAATASAPTSPTSSTSSSSAGDSCADAWTACNEAYMTSQADAVTASADASYTCQTQYVQCVAQSMSAASSTVDTATIVAPTSVSSVVVPSSASVAPTQTVISSSAASSSSVISSSAVASSADTSATASSSAAVSSSASAVTTSVPSGTVTSTASSESSTSGSNDDDGEGCEEEDDEEEEDGTGDAPSLSARSVPSGTSEFSTWSEDEDDFDCTGDGEDASSSSPSSVATSSSASSATPVTVPTTTPIATPSSGSSSSAGDSCTNAWTACNEAYLNAEGAAATGSTTSYTCQAQYVQCVAQSMSSSAAPTVAARSFAQHLRRHHAGVSRMEFH